MQQYLMRSAMLLSTFALLGLWSCGQSGSDPVQFPEVRFEVHPAGQSTFRVDSLIASGVSHSSVVGQEFTATSSFNFVLENAAPPYVGSFTLTSGDQITVTLSVIGQFGQTQVSDATAVGKPTATVVTCTASTNPPTNNPPGCSVPTNPPPSNPEARIDVCAPFTVPGSCSTTSTTGDVGAFGVLFSGTLGDLFTSHVLIGATPTIYFLEAPQDSVNAVFVRQVITGDLLVASLFFNGVFQQTQATANQVVLSQDVP